MRWNCPHCEELVTAGIDFVATKKAYVRCAKCNGMALIHRSAAFADYVKARRLEEETQLENEIRLANSARLAAEFETLAKRKETEEASTILSLPTPVVESATTLAGLERVSPEPIATPIPTPMRMAATSVPTATPPPFPKILANATPIPAALFDDLSAGFDPIVETSGIYTLNEIISAPSAALSTGEGATAAALPVFDYVTPPPFLTKATPIPTTEFASTENAPIETAMAAASTTRSSNLGIWIAAGLALASGIFLYIQGRQVF